MSIHEGRFNVNTKWSKGDIIKADGDIGKLSIDKNTIMFHIDGSRDFFARNFVGSDDMHTYKVFTYGPGKSDSSGYFCNVAKVFLYNGIDYMDYTENNIEGIESFSFEIPELTDWLMIPSVKISAFEDGTSVIHELETPTFILRESNPKIYIKFEIRDFFEGTNNRNEMSLKKAPRVFVEFDSLVNDNEVTLNIEILMRFFSLLIGRISTSNDIRLTLHGKDMKMWLFLNHDFSVNNNIKAYCMSYRTKSENFLKLLSQKFEKWYSFSCDDSFKFLQDAYFSTCSKKLWAIEEMFLTYCRFLEGYDLRVSKDENTANILFESLKEAMKEKAISEVLSEEFKKVGSKYRYKDVAKWISSGFLGRISLDNRIKRLDEKYYGIIAANSNSISKTDSPINFYSKIAKTRNYYSHFKPDKTDILNITEIYYLLPVMDAIIIAILMSEMGIDSETIKSILLHDKVYHYLVTHLQTGEKKE